MKKLNQHATSSILHSHVLSIMHSQLSWRSKTNESSNDKGESSILFYKRLPNIVQMAEGVTPINPSIYLASYLILKWIMRLMEKCDKMKSIHVHDSSKYNFNCLVHLSLELTRTHHPGQQNRLPYVSQLDTTFMLRIHSCTLIILLNSKV